MSVFVNLDALVFKVSRFIGKVKLNDGVYKYTLNHDPHKFPAALLYGTWSVVYLNHLISEKTGWLIDRNATLKYLLSNRKEDGMYWPVGLSDSKLPKSVEYVLLHIYNYVTGALLILDPNHDFQAGFMDYYLDADNLARWLNQRSLLRPWEESNNIVNVASYLALCNDFGDKRGQERLFQMLEWHKRHQNPFTGGFDNLRPTRKNILQSMAGAVHNFHIHHYLNEEMGFEEKISSNVIPFLFSGPLSACLSIDFVELCCRTALFSKNQNIVQQALLYHLQKLLKYQNSDGGWYENDSPSKPTVGFAMKEDVASSNTYATWFRMCSIAMIMITLFGDDPQKWHFRKTLGMGYASENWSQLELKNESLDKGLILKYKINNFPNSLKSKIIEIGAKIMN